MHEIKSFQILKTAIVVGLLHTIFFAVIAAIEILLMFSFSPHPTKPPLSSMLIGPPFMGVVFLNHRTFLLDVQPDCGTHRRHRV